eukprot:jgi/Tetstr1/425147/TSEL_015609.t1
MISRSSARGSSRGAAADTAAAVRELSEMVRSGESTAVWVRLRSLLFVAARHANLPVLAYLLDELRVPVTTADGGGATLLHHAVAGSAPATLRWAARRRDAAAAAVHLRPDSAGRSPLAAAAGEGAVECVEALVDAIAVLHFGHEAAVLPAVQAARAAAEAALRGAGRRPAARLAHVVQILDSALRVAALSHVRCVLWMSEEEAPAAAAAGTCGQPVGSVKMAAILAHVHAEPWWAEFEASAAGAVGPPAGRSAREEADGYLTLQTAVAKSEPAVVAWLLDVWRFGFGARRHAAFTLADCACAPGEAAVQGAAAPGRAWTRWWADTLLRWAGWDNANDTVGGACTAAHVCAADAQGHAHDSICDGAREDAHDGSGTACNGALCYDTSGTEDGGYDALYYGTDEGADPAHDGAPGHGGSLGMKGLGVAPAVSQLVEALRREGIRVGGDAARRELLLLDDVGARGGPRRRAAMVATLRLFVDRFNEHAVPRLDLLVKDGNWHTFAWLLEEHLVDLAAPVWEVGDSDSGEREGDGEGGSECGDQAGTCGDVCGICIDALPAAGFACALQCGHRLCTRCTRELFAYHATAADSPSTVPALPATLPCPICRREVAAPRIVHGDVVQKLRHHLPREAPWLLANSLASAASPAATDRTDEHVASGPAAGEMRGRSLGELLMALAAGYGSGAFLEALLAAGVRPHRVRAGGGRTLLHIACERRQPVPLLWLLAHAADAGAAHLERCLTATDSAGRRAIDAAVDAQFDLGVQALLLGRRRCAADSLELRAAFPRTPTGWLGRALRSSAPELRRRAEAYLASHVLAADGDIARRVAAGCPLEEVAPALTDHRPLRYAVEEHLASVRGDMGAGASPSPLRCFVYDVVVGAARTDILRWLLLHGWAQLAPAMASPPPLITRDAVVAAATAQRAGGSAFEALFDEVEALLGALARAEAQHRAFAESVTAGELRRR